MIEEAISGTVSPFGQYRKRTDLRRFQGRLKSKEVYMARA
jgi:hypothetical protein